MKHSLILFLLLYISPLIVNAEYKPKSIEKQLEILKTHPENGEALNNLCNYYLTNGDYSKAVTYAEYMKNISIKSNDNSFLLYSYLYLGEAQLMSGREKASKNNLNNALIIASKEKNDSAICIIYGSLGQYSANIETDYYRAIQWIYKGVTLSRKRGYDKLTAQLLNKLANIYYLKRDKEGLRYALESYEIGYRLNNTSVIYESAVNSAYMYFLLKDDEKAIKYLHEAENLMKKIKVYDSANTYNLLGNLFLDRKEYNQAIEYYKKAMSDKQSAKSASIVYAYLGYAKVLMAQNKFAEAIEMLKHGLAISNARANAVHRNSIYEAISLCYEKLNNYSQSLNYYKIFRHENDSLFNKDKERDINELMFKYDTEKQNNIIKQSKIEVVNKEKKIQQQYFILLIIIIIALLLYYLYRRKNTLYIKIVQQNQDAIRRENKLHERIKELEDIENVKIIPQEKYASSSLTDEKSLEIFNKLESIMQDNKAYKDSLLTKDKVAEMIGTNRTYLSRIINEQTKLSFTHYINSFRIEEAVKLLSDPNNVTPLKALSVELGFKSISTFYNLFQSSVGMTPSQYRSKVIELNNK